jgi:hypothetical protein
VSAARPLRLLLGEALRDEAEVRRRRARVATLFSYVVDHDLGFAPNPYDGFCTLVHCKFGGVGGQPNIVELAEEEDWGLGSGGQSKQSAGNGKIIYLMRVDEKLAFPQYLQDARFQGRADCIDRGLGNKFALVSWTYFYFGKNALSVSELPSAVVPTLLKKGIGFRRDLPEATLNRLTAWFSRTYEIGMHGDPCASSRETLQLHKRRTSRSSRPGPLTVLRSTRSLGGPCG